MRYKNKRTGVTIDVTSKISGGDWFPVDEVTEKEVEETEELQEEQREETEEVVEEEVDLKELTNKQLEDLAKEQGIELTAEDKKNKDTRIDAIVAAFE